jgi:hypothetical protein
MEYGIIHYFPGGTKDNYEAAIAAVHSRSDSLPDGQIFHAAGPSPGGWTIVTVYESKERWQQFRDGVLMPKMQQGVEGGFSTAPEETVVEVYKLLR